MIRLVPNTQQSSYQIRLQNHLERQAIRLVQVARAENEFSHSQKRKLVKLRSWLQAYEINSLSFQAARSNHFDAPYNCFPDEDWCGRDCSCVFSLYGKRIRF